MQNRKIAAAAGTVLAGLVATVAPTVPAQAHEGTTPHAHIVKQTRCATEDVRLVVKLVNNTGKPATFTVKVRHAHDGKGVHNHRSVVRLPGRSGTKQRAFYATPEIPLLRIAVRLNGERVAFKRVKYDAVCGA